MTDLSRSGFRDEQDFALTGPLPQDPAAIETFNVWLHDGPAKLGVNLHPHAHDGVMSGSVTVFLPDGRVLRGQTEAGAFTDPRRPGNRHFRLDCERPFESWRYSVIELPMFEMSAQDLDRGPTAAGDPTHTVSVEVTAQAAAPPWDWGNLLPEARQACTGRPGLWIANRLTHGRVEGVSYRYDQAIAAHGTVTVDGLAHDFDGTGLRGHVRGVRIMDGFETHAWMGGVFGSGLAFGVNTMYRSDGGFHVNEGYVFRDGVFYPNRVRYATELDPASPDTDGFVVELVCDELGLTRITGRDVAKLWWAMGGPAKASAQPGSIAAGGLAFGRDLSVPRLMSQALARFECESGGDLDVGYGMDERSGWAATRDAR